MLRLYKNNLVNYVTYNNISSPINQREKQQQMMQKCINDNNNNNTFALPSSRINPSPTSPSSSFSSLTSEAVDEISSRVRAEVLEMKQRRIKGLELASDDKDRSVKTRKAAVETTRPSTMCVIL